MQGVTSDLCSLQMEPITARLISCSLAYHLRMYTLPVALHFLKKLNPNDPKNEILVCKGGKKHKQAKNYDYCRVLSIFWMMRLQFLPQRRRKIFALKQYMPTFTNLSRWQKATGRPYWSLQSQMLFWWPDGRLRWSGTLLGTGLSFLTYYPEFEMVIVNYIGNHPLSDPNHWKSSRKRQPILQRSMEIKRRVSLLRKKRNMIMISCGPRVLRIRPSG